MANVVSWKEEPDEHDYPAASAYLSLLADDEAVRQMVADLKASPLKYGKAKDILRASRLTLLPLDNPHVNADITKVKDGKSLSPILLVRGDLRHDIALQIADGYHRVCASYHLAEDTDIPYRMAMVERGH